MHYFYNFHDLRLFIQRKAVARKKSHQASYILTSKPALAPNLMPQPLPWDRLLAPFTNSQLPPMTLIQGSWKDAGLSVLSRSLKDSEKLRPQLTWLLQGVGAGVSLWSGLTGCCPCQGCLSISVALAMAAAVEAQTSGWPSVVKHTMFHLKVKLSSLLPAHEERKRKNQKFFLGKLFSGKTRKIKKTSLLNVYFDTWHIFEICI